MNLLLVASAALALLAPLQATPVINVDTKTGDTITGQKTFSVTVSSDDVINSVEFYVNDDLQDTQTSTPYTFQLDTVGQSDGPIKVSFKAYTSQNKTATKVLNLTIDNQKSKGADFHVTAGQSDLADGKFQAAVDEGRIALSIDATSNGARYILARANLELKVFDKAQKYAEDAVAQDPKDDQAYQVLSAIDAHRGFSTIAKEGSDRAEVIASIGDAFKGAVEARQKSLDIEMSQLAAPTPANATSEADMALRAGRYSLVINSLAPMMLQDNKNVAIAKRLAFAQLRAGRLRDSLQTLTDLKMYTTPDAYCFALMALVYTELNQDDQATDAIKTAVESDPDDTGVRTAQAFIALKRNKTNVLAGLTNDLAQDQAQSPLVSYFLMALADRQQRFGDARRYFERSVLAEPANAEPYVEQANYDVGLSLNTKLEKTEKAYLLQEAKMYFQTALIARPESVEGLAGVAMIDMLQNHVTEAVQYAEAARDASPTEALGHYAAAGAYQMKAAVTTGKEQDGFLTKTQEESKLAAQLDQSHLLGVGSPTGKALWTYLNTAGRTAVVSYP